MLFEQFWRVAKLNAAVVLFSQMPFGSDLIQCQRKLFRYEWIWRKNLGTGFLNAKRMPLKLHEVLLVFYRKLPTYNPQFSEGKPWKRHGMSGSKNYAEFREGYKMRIAESDGGKRYPVDVINFQMPYTKLPKLEHPQQKPVDLLEYLIRTYTDEGELVLDATMGSGSTGVAAVNTGRRFIGFETEQKFCDIAEKRISEAVAQREQSLF